ncbi:MAG: hypothetical protein CMP51_02820 [Flavobacteriales bacterium]|nr:hypothetical protein [Flavobacteriales bacterium]
MKYIRIFKFTLILVTLILSCNSNNINKNLNATSFYELVNEGNGIILDVRTKTEYDNGHLENALNIDYWSSDLEEQLLNLLPKNMSIYVYCRSGTRSLKTINILYKLGYTDVYGLDGGILSWKENKYPIAEGVLTQSELIIQSDLLEVISSDKKVFISIGGDYCPPCRKMKPIIDSLESLKTSVKFARFNLSHLDEDVISSYEASSIPLFIFFNEGIEEWRHYGLISKNELLNKF